MLQSERDRETETETETDKDRQTERSVLCICEAVFADIRNPKEISHVILSGITAQGFAINTTRQITP